MVAFSKIAKASMLPSGAMAVLLTRSDDNSKKSSEVQSSSRQSVMSGYSAEKSSGGKNQ